MKKATSKLTIFVSSAVYGIEDVLDRIYAMLTLFGYEVWMSHKGTLPVFSNKSSFENCLEGVRKCHIFLGILGTRYGSGLDKKKPDSISITHQELRLAIELKKMRWLLAHQNIVTARTLFAKIGYVGVEGRRKLNLMPSEVLSDKRLIDMYEEAILDHLPIEERRGNWAQKYAGENSDDFRQYFMFQFQRYQEIEAYLRENFEHAPPFSESRGET